MIKCSTVYAFWIMGNTDIMMTEEDFLNSANKLLQSLCDKYELNRIEIRAEVFYGADMTKPSKFCSDNNYIAINKYFLEKYRPYVFHEFRHYWQREKYPDVFKWWLVDHKDLYMDFQEARDKQGNPLAYTYCPLEKDAVSFEKSNGEKDCEEDLINPKLKEMKESDWRKILRENAASWSSF